MHHGEMNELIGRLFDECEEHGAARAQIALAILTAQRHAAAAARALEMATTLLTGITPTGRELA